MKKDLSFRDKLWPDKTGNVPVKLLSDDRLRMTIILLHKIHQEARSVRNKLMKYNRLHDEPAELLLIKAKLITIREWNNILRCEESYRKNQGIKVKDEHIHRFTELSPVFLKPDDTR